MKRMLELINDMEHACTRGDTNNHSNRARELREQLKNHWDLYNLTRALTCSYAAAIISQGVSVGAGTCLLIVMGLTYFVSRRS